MAVLKNAFGSAFVEWRRQPINSQLVEQAPHSLKKTRSPSAERWTILARHTCFCGLLRFLATACRRPRTAGVTVRIIPLRIPETRMRRFKLESQTGFKCQILSTRPCAWARVFIPILDVMLSAARAIAAFAGVLPGLKP